MQKLSTFAIDDGGWIHCPVCGCRTRTKIRDDTSVKNFPIFCPKCRHEAVVDVENNHIRLSIVPDAKTQSR
ncbi:MAG: cysteine-rich KTR domain-containing protein [Peptococcaceae bacterium]|nr:cysteine-rich KTR domain-containing protein [Peptococcaceae bacterium]